LHQRILLAHHTYKKSKEKTLQTIKDLLYYRSGQEKVLDLGKNYLLGVKEAGGK
tara:strand:- start:622 stop:783 length:162 start_codon:yes stop_codon:yes gene_type:complete